MITLLRIVKNESFKCFSKNFQDDLSQQMVKARAFRSLGEAYAYMDQYEEGLTYLKLFRDISKTEKDDVEYQRALTAIGWCYLEFGKFMERQWDEEGKTDDSKKDHIQETYLKADKFSRNAYSAIPEGVEVDKCPLKERKEMKIVVLINRGLVAMALKNLENANSYFLEACDIAKDCTILYDKYYVTLLLHRSVIHMKEGKYSSALKINKDIMAALEKLPISDTEKHQLHNDALNQKIQILIGLRQFQQAKKISKRIFVRNGASVDDPIYKYLKSTVSICRLIKVINESNGNDRSMIKTHERIGDLCVSLERYDTANFYYEKAAELLNSIDLEDNKLLGALYFSVAENCIDLEDFEKASAFYNKKLELCGQDAKEACQTTLRLAKCSHLYGRHLEDVLSLCNEARKLALRSGRMALEARVVQVTYGYHRKHGSSSSDVIKNELERLITQYDLNENELEIEENDQEDLVSEASEEFSLDALSEDDDEDSDHELKCFGGGQVKSGRKRGSFKHNTNAKGESDLHVKCQEEGNLEAIQTLIKMGHELNFADRAKFTPIHEACNYGFLEYVKELHISGAKLNLKSNSGVTPLITACSNGSIDIIEYLINAGALVHLQEECGWTAKDHLINYFRINRSSITDEMQDRYKTVIRKMDSGMKGYELLPKKKVSTVFETEGEQDFILQDDVESWNSSENSTENKFSRLGRKHFSNRNKADVRKALQPVHSPDMFNLDSNSVKNYVDAVSGVKKRRLVQPKLSLPQSTKNNSHTQPSPSLRQSIKNSDDDWLVDDMPKVNKKFKSDIRNSFRTQEYKDSKRQRLERSDVKNNVQTNRNIEQKISYSRNDLSEIALPSEVDDFPITSTQLTSKVSSDIPPFLEKSLSNESPAKPMTTDCQEVRSLPPMNNVATNILRFSVQIEERRLLIPISQEKCISDLSKAVMQRFNNTSEVNKGTGRMPVLRLLDNEGCELDNGDRLIDLFGETSQPIRLQCRVEKWELDKIESVYEKLCQDMNTIHLPEAEHALTESQKIASLNLNKSVIRSESSQPIFRSLRFRSHITEINLSGNKLGVPSKGAIYTDESSLKCMEELGASIQTLNSLTRLDISSNALRSKHLNTLTRAMFRSSASGSESVECRINLREINLGFNELEDECDNAIIFLFDSCQYLESLNMSNCDLTKDFFLRNYKRWEATFEKKILCPLKHIDISCNPKIGVIGIDKILQLLNPNALLSINLKSCTEKSNNVMENLGDAVFRFASRGRPDIALQEVDLSQNKNVEIEDLCNALYHMSHLKKMDISYCDGVTFDFVVKLFEEMWTQSLNCEKIKIRSNSNFWNDVKADPDSFDRLLSNMKLLTSENSLKHLEVSFQQEADSEREVMKDLILNWYNVFKENSKIEMSCQNVIMSVFTC